MRLFTVLFLFLTVTFSCLAQDRAFKLQRLEAKDHVALIIGNSDYPDMPLLNPVNDANDVAEAFENMGFIVDKILNADKETMSLAISRFSERLKTARAAVFYFAGHGFQINGENYLLPVGRTPSTQISRESQIPYRAINANEILSEIENQKVKFSLIVFDACRNNPVRGSSRGKIKGLASIDAPVGSLVMYATKAGEIAKDGNGRNSPFTTAFLKHITTPGLDVNLLPSRVTQTVLEITNGKQTPGSYVQLTQSFTFVPELSSDEWQDIKNRRIFQLRGQLSELQKLEKEIAQRKIEEESRLKKKQNEIDSLEKQIDVLKKKVGSDHGNSDDLDKILSVVRERENQMKELEELRKEVEREQMVREKQVYELKMQERKEKNNSLNTDLEKYTEIAKSEFGRDMKETAWNSILKKWGIPTDSIQVGDENSLRVKVLKIPANFTDLRNNKKYNTVVIGSQVWMAENLAFYTKKGCWAYENDSTNVLRYGYLYNWETAKQVCPAGWHLPSKEEFDELLKNVRSNDSIAYNLLIEGGSSGFSALPGGWRVGSSFTDLGEGAYFWSSTSDGKDGCWYLYIYNYLKNAFMHNYLPSCGFSVRCISDN